MNNGLYASEVKSPISILSAEIDQYSPPELVKQFEEIFSGKPEVRSSGILMNYLGIV